MQEQSPNFKMKQMTPLSLNQKQIIEDEPNDEIFELNSTKISFNEKIIVCNYKPWQNVIQLRKTIQKLMAYKDINWINPILTQNQKNGNPSRSILKNQSSNKHEFSPEI
ncbi:unnamed protein product [Paramecium sonneborni]|uniref:Uncharacterized protein n=1 Tax=Paramecium sonneborni TaxID=65129 RepID=A0A8S1MDL7_9CILI|nr:unnamed protein product [Paramecium sonneborni]